MPHVPSDEELMAQIERLSKIEDKSNVILSKKEAEGIRDVLIAVQKFKLMKTFVGYSVAFLAAYVAFKADLSAFFSGGEK